MTQGLERKTHFADFEITRTEQGVQVVALPSPVLPGHQWNCNASLPGWADVKVLWDQLQLPRIYLCETHAKRMGLDW